MTKQEQNKLRQILGLIDTSRDHLNTCMGDPLLWEPEAVIQHFEDLKRGVENIFRRP